jgi:hypothetical protein
VSSFSLLQLLYDSFVFSKGNTSSVKQYVELRKLEKKLVMQERTTRKI